MSKTLTITCDICDADITKSSRVELSWVHDDIPMLSLTTYFCGYEHMYQFVDMRRPEESE